MVDSNSSKPPGVVLQIHGEIISRVPLENEDNQILNHQDLDTSIQNTYLNNDKEDEVYTLSCRVFIYVHVYQQIREVT